MEKTLCKLSLLVAFAFFLTRSPAWADGNSLLQSCQMAERSLDGEKTNTDDFQQGFCMGLIHGVGSTMIAYDRVLIVPGVLSLEGPKTCWPEGLSNAQATRIVVKYLKDNPSQLYFDDFVLVMMALRNAFECK